MKITLNFTSALRPTTGIGTYARELVSSLLECDHENKYTLLFSQNPFFKRELKKSIIDNKQLTFSPINLPYRFLNFLWNDLGVISVENICGECDIFHSLDTLSPLARQARLVTTVHDINWLIFNDNSRWRKRSLYKYLIKSLMRSKIVIVDSTFSKIELLKYFPTLNADKIEVTPLGVSDTFKTMDMSLIENKRKGCKWGEFILYIGVLDQSRKNLIRLVKAYQSLKKKNRIKERLVLLGRVSNNSKELLKLINKLNLSKDVIIHSKWIPDDDIPLIYNMARLVVYPSLYEGFGLPVLEAMACGTPVVASNTSSMPEVGGEACLYIDPYDVKSLADGIEKAVYDEELRNNLRYKGFERIKNFTWQNTARMTLEIYKKALG